jgi:hypothetical protein
MVPKDHPRLESASCIERPRKHGRTAFRSQWGWNFPYTPKDFLHEELQVGNANMQGPQIVTPRHHRSHMRTEILRLVRCTSNAFSSGCSRSFAISYCVPSSKCSLQGSCPVSVCWGPSMHPRCCPRVRSFPHARDAGMCHLQRGKFTELQQSDVCLFRVGYAE